MSPRSDRNTPPPGAPALQSSSSHAVLRVIDELRVGPVRVEANRLVAPYTVVFGGREETTDLIYRYEEPVFDPSSPVDHNLANMIAAQVALNYGLFCDRIVFRGTFDAADRSFLEEMAENTAREIYVVKILQPNPFLDDTARGLQAERLPRYLHARLEFPDANEKPVPWSPRESRSGRVAILSSGGKDSLLSYGLLNEAGAETHPIFGNESGRHWFTALNAFRHFEASVANTARVWMNSDRVFAWMLRRLPFVRQDFANVRSDEYPIRLWTVAVFLFGALPLIRKRGIGRVVIGDEYDTTVRMTHEGIPHYNGLYDQSRYFDNALSRYYGRKRWALAQFSILRQASELLIEKTLVERYPTLFADQVSCHATSVDDGRVRPCGKCEKCRRIVGMVMAIGGDPTRCGYTAEQIKECLTELANHGAHQERAGVQQMLWMLSRRGVIQLPAERAKMARHNREVLKLRFDRERSPMVSFPQDLREPVFRMILEHADGAVQRKGRSWLEFDPMRDPSLHHPYSFERNRPASETRPGVGAGARTHVLGEMTWPQARKHFRAVDVALLPVGAIEQHGPHLPLDTDAFDADYLAKIVAERCSSPRPIVFPCVPYGVSYHHEDFAGTISVSNETLAQLVYEIGMSAARNGITKLVIINGHGGNDPSLNFAAQKINRDAHILTCVDSGETSDVDVYAMIDTPNDVHAGEIETSTSLAVRPELVDMSKAKSQVPAFSSRYLDFTSKRGISWHAYTRRISTTGVMGDPTKATAEKGERMWEIMIQHLVAFVEDLKRLTLDEIFQKRY